MVDEKEASESFSFDDCQATVLRCADLLSRRVSDEEQLASQLTLLAKLHVQLQQVEPRSTSPQC